MSAPATPLLLELEGVTRRDAHERVVLREVSLALRAGELVGVWGMRRSGRSTLLRIAAGVQAPDAGVVRYGGRELTAGAGEALGGEIGYCRLPPTAARAATCWRSCSSTSSRGGCAPPTRARARGSPWSARAHWSAPRMRRASSTPPRPRAWASPARSRWAPRCW